MRESKEKREKNKTQYSKNNDFMKIVNRKQNQNINSYDYSHFQNVVGMNFFFFFFFFFYKNNK